MKVNILNQEYPTEYFLEVRMNYFVVKNLNESECWDIIIRDINWIFLLLRITELTAKSFFDSLKVYYVLYVPGKFSSFSI